MILGDRPLEPKLYRRRVCRPASIKDAFGCVLQSALRRRFLLEGRWITGEGSLITDLYAILSELD